MRRWTIGLVATCFFLALGAVPAHGQETRGAIEGIVKDGTGGVLPGVTVTAKLATTGASQTAITDSIGSYRFPTLAPGLYIVTSTMQGFGAQTFDKVDLQVGKVLRVNFTLEVAGVAVTETVRATTPIVDVSQNAVQSTVKADVIALDAQHEPGLSVRADRDRGHELRNGHLRIARDGRDDRRRVSIRESLRHRRPGHDQLAQRTLRQGSRRRFHRTDSGEAVRLQRGIPGHHGWRGERDHEERHEPVPRRRGVRLQRPAPEWPARRHPPDAPARSERQRQQPAGGVHHDAAHQRIRTGDGRADRGLRRADRPEPRVVLLRRQ